MGRNVFISFLGTGKYISCRYISNEKGISKVVEYVQDAILELYCSDFKEEDAAYIFLTKGAEEKHWENLKSAIGEKKFQVNPIFNVPDGNTEKEIWEIFEVVFNELKKDDKIILDVTHGFRSLPMLGIVLLNYAKFLKNIMVSNILYGAFDALGPASEIEKRIPNPEDRNAPLIDLTTFSAIQSWTFGAASFIETGSTKRITNLSLNDINPILAKSKGSDITASNIRILMKSLEEIEVAINSNRGKVIIKENFVKGAQTPLEKLLQDSSQVLAPIKPILKQIEDKLKDFKELPNWEAAVQWCINHNLVQQGITQLQEGIITLICEQHQLCSNKEDERGIASSALNIFINKIEENGWKEPAFSNKEKVYEIIQSTFVKSYKDSFSTLFSLRNDINHGGYKENSKLNGIKFKTLLNELFDSYKKLQYPRVGIIKESTPHKLINLSNHSSINWTEEQMITATNKYGTVEDVPFPQINPLSSSEEVEQLASSYLDKIMEMQPCTVHIMGEMTFTYKLISLLQQHNILCIASTTERIAVENENIKTSLFKFMGFREY